MRTMVLRNLPRESVRDVPWMQLHHLDRPVKLGTDKGLACRFVQAMSVKMDIPSVVVCYDSPG